MLRIYFEEIFKYKTNAQLEHIKKALMAVNVHIAASTLTGAGYALAVANSALYMQQLEMMYFLIEPVFERAGALEAQWSSG